MLGQLTNFLWAVSRKKKMRPDPLKANPSSTFGYLETNEAPKEGGSHQLRSTS